MVDSHQPKCPEEAEPFTTSDKIEANRHPQRDQRIHNKGDKAAKEEAAKEEAAKEDQMRATTSGKADEGRTRGARGVVPPTDMTKRSGLALFASTLRPSVEVPGIEPGSFAGSTGLLRAQLAVPLLGPTDHASESV